MLPSSFEGFTLTNCIKVFHTPSIEAQNIAKIDLQALWQLGNEKCDKVDINCTH